MAHPPQFDDSAARALLRFSSVPTLGFDEEERAARKEAFEALLQQAYQLLLDYYVERVSLQEARGRNPMILFVRREDGRQLGVGFTGRRLTLRESNPLDVVGFDTQSDLDDVVFDRVDGQLHARDPEEEPARDREDNPLTVLMRAILERIDVEP